MRNSNEKISRPALKFLVVGCGRFGRWAVEQIRQKLPWSIIEVVDISPVALDAVQSRGIVRICSDGVDYMVESLSNPYAPHWVVPTVPFHLVYEWLVRVLEKKHKVERLTVPEEIKFPGELRLTSWEVYSTLTDSICPADCPGPRAGHCHLTGRRQEYPLFRILENLGSGQFICRVIRSRQLAPGVGGIRGADLRGLPDEVASVKLPVLLSTASHCHGVTAALRVSDFA
jgi:hypothetical protein